MANEIVVKNTLAFQFPGNAAQPSLEDMGRFVKSLKGDRKMMDTAYKISDEKAVFIRFKSEEAMVFSFENNPTTLPFKYTNGKQVTVTMSVAGGNTRYVRVFDLPPEATDLDLSAVLGKYGSIKRIVRERFPADMELDMYSGVRGLYMDMQRDIPEVLHFRGRKGRIFFDGIRSRCYVCKSDEHLKKACPIFKARRDETEEQQKQQNGSPTAERSVEAGTGEAVAPVPASTAQSSKQVTSKNRAMDKRQRSIESELIDQPEGKKKTTTVNSENESDDDLEITDWMNATPEKRQEWREKNDRKNRRRYRKIELLLSKQTL